jgi:hypothetical protein
MFARACEETKLVRILSLLALGLIPLRFNDGYEGLQIDDMIQKGGFDGGKLGLARRSNRAYLAAGKTASETSGLLQAHGPHITSVKPSML